MSMSVSMHEVTAVIAVDNSAPGHPGAVVQIQTDGRAMIGLAEFYLHVEKLEDAERIADAIRSAFGLNAEPQKKAA